MRLTCPNENVAHTGSNAIASTPTGMNHHRIPRPRRPRRDAADSARRVTSMSAAHDVAVTSVAATGNARCPSGAITIAPKGGYVNGNDATGYCWS